MKSSLELPEVPLAPDWNRKAWLRCVVVVGTLLALAMAMFWVRQPSSASPDPKPTLTAHKPTNALAQEVIDDAPMPVDLYRFALNALLVPLLDDARPLRWTDLAIDFACDPGTTVLIDGEPLVSGKLVPTKDFTVRWNMANCAPMGPESVKLSGIVDLVVHYKHAKLHAVVKPDGLRVDSALGRAWLHGPFSAETSLTSSNDEP
jgi:hypothetical protein